MDASRKPCISLLTVLLATTGCADLVDAPGSDEAETNGQEGFEGTFIDESESESGSESDSGNETDTDDPSTGTSEDSGTDDSIEMPVCDLDCGAGTCVNIERSMYCECPEGTEWAEFGCEPCPIVDAAALDLALPMVSFEGRFSVGGAAPPKSEYDDANVWLENQRTNDRVLLGNTHDELFSVRVTPGIYDLVYELETPGAVLPRNRRVQLSKVALFDSEVQDIDIPVATIGGPILLDGAAPPVTEYDDAQILFRDILHGDEVVAGNTHDGSYAITLIPGDYEVVYRVQTPGPIAPRNDGAVLMALSVVEDTRVQPIEIHSVSLHGDFLINAAPPPVSEYDDANIELESPTAGTVLLGNTHDGAYARNLLPGSYDVVYRHETGPNVPQNHRARFTTLEVTLDPNGNTANIDVPMVELSGALTINAAAPPVSEYDDGLLFLQGTGANADDSVLLGNTHDSSYQVRLIPSSYDVYYAQETSGGTVPDNKHASVLVGLDALVSANDVNIDVAAVAISGAFTLDNVAPPTSEYDNGRIYLRNNATSDAVLLGSTHEGSYSAIVVPGDYEIFYEQETGGALLPSNLNAGLGSVTIDGPMSLDLDLPVVALAGQVTLGGAPPPMSASDGGQLYLRTLAGDSVLLGHSFVPSYAIKLVAGTYGVYYRSEASVTTPQNENGRFACITVQ